MADELNQDEIVTVELGENTKTVEEEIQAVTPQENPEDVEDKKEEVTPKPEETPKESEEVSEPVGDNAEEVSNAEEVKEEKKETEEEQPQEETNEEEEIEDLENTNTEVETENLDHSKELEELEALRNEIAEMKEAEEVRQMSVAREQAIATASQQMDEFNTRLSNAMVDTLKQYGIDPETTFEELQKDPAKLQIARDIVQNAQRIQQEKQAELMKPITEASNALIFREASKAMAAFNLTDEQTKVAAETLINIFDATGLANLNDDLKAKVELAVARAKMIAPKVEKVVEEVKEIVEDTKEAVKDVIEEKAPEEDVQEVIEEKPSLEAFKEGATADANVSGPVETVTKENVLQILKTLPHKDRAAFFKANQRAIDEAMTEAHKRLGK